MDGLGVVSHPNLGESRKNEIMVTASVGVASSEIRTERASFQSDQGLLFRWRDGEVAVPP